MSSIIKPVLGSQLEFGHPLARGLVGCWLFNEGSGNKVFDLSGNNNTGTLQDTTFWTPGNTGSSLDFSTAITDYVNIPSTPSLQIANNMTIVCSIYANAGADNEGLVAGIDATLDVTDFALGILSGGGNIFFQVLEGGNPFIQAAFIHNKWTHIAFVLDSSNNGEIFIDGVSGGSGALAAISPGAVNYTIGSYDPDPGVGFDGRIEYVMIYNRALSASEVALLHREPFCMFGRDLIELWAATTQGAGAPAGIPILRRRRAG